MPNLLFSILSIFLHTQYFFCSDEETSPRPIMAYEDSRQSPIYEEIHFPVPIVEQRLQETKHFLHQMASSHMTSSKSVTGSTSVFSSTISKVTNVKMSSSKKVQQQEVKVVKQKGSTTHFIRQSKLSLKHLLDHRSELFLQHASIPLLSAKLVCFPACSNFSSVMLY